MASKPTNPKTFSSSTELEKLIQQQQNQNTATSGKSPAVTNTATSIKRYYHYNFQMLSDPINHFE